MLSAWYVIPAAVGLDLLMGDPLWLPHPVRLMGLAAERTERVFRRLVKNHFFAGMAFAVVLVCSAYLAAICLVFLAGLIHPAAQIICEITLLYTCLSARCLYTEAKKVHAALLSGDQDRARRLVAMLVSRDTGQMDEAGLSRAAVETVAENFVDGVLSPLFFAVLLGAPGAIAFKMISTLDSMAGYRTERYEQFGKTAARLDDAANWIPARLSVPIISLAAVLILGRGRRSFVTALAEGKNHKSPNAGLPEAAFAGALCIRLIGPGTYHGIYVEKPWIGTNFPLPLAKHIPEACRLMIVSSIIAPFLMIVIFTSIGLV
ncbi:MAG: adenosylcobinamide-phosphate synthase CbiB [Desulfobacteraceae bacterium]|nr:adenosylcobinamide-phosphate synthase CbiB [Desulfobacteraceae bacterium]